MAGVMDKLRPWLPFAALFGLPACIVAIPGAYAVVEPLFPAHRQFVREEVSPTRVDTLQNTVAIISAEKQSIKIRLQMAKARLAVAPNDAVAQDAWDSANEDWVGAEFRERQAQCATRQAQGLGCAGG